MWVRIPTMARRHNPFAPNMPDLPRIQGLQEERCSWQPTSCGRLQDAANATTAATNRAVNAAGKASARMSAVAPARPHRTNANAGTPVTRNSAVTTRPAPSSRPLVAASDPDMKVANATMLHTAASARQAMMVAVRRFTLQGNPSLRGGGRARDYYGRC